MAPASRLAPLVWSVTSAGLVYVDAETTSACFSLTSFKDQDGQATPAPPAGLGVFGLGALLITGWVLWLSIKALLQKSPTSRAPNYLGMIAVLLSCVFLVFFVAASGS